MIRARKGDRSHLVHAVFVCAVCLLMVVGADGFAQPGNQSVGDEERTGGEVQATSPRDLESRTVQRLQVGRAKGSDANRLDEVLETDIASVVDSGVKTAKKAKRVAGGPSLENLPGYHLGPGDVVEIIYQLTNRKRDEPYRLDISDELEISFPFTPAYNSKPVVRSDGKVALPLIGDYEVFGKTTEQLNAELTERFSSMLKDPVVQVRLLRSNSAIEELKRAITTAPRGQSRLEPVRPDGFISLPLIGDVMAAGLAVPALSKAIIAKYRDAGIVDIDVTVVLLEVRSPVAYVMGGVVNPGPIVLQGPSDAWRLISTAGGFTLDADNRHVIVVKSSGEEETRIVIDYRQWMASLDSRHNAQIERGDIVYVPKGTDMFVYVSGEVQRPGAVAVQTDQIITVSQAIAAAGGLAEKACESQVLVLRKGMFNRPIVEEAPYKQLFDPSNNSAEMQNRAVDVRLKPGDVVYVPRSRVGNFGKFAKDYFKDGIWTLIPFNLSATYRLDNGSSE